MDLDPVAQSTTISGDLPIRTGKPMEPSISADTENTPSHNSSWPSKPKTNEIAPDDQLPQSKHQVGVPQTKLDDEVAIRVGEIMASTCSKAKRRKPKSKRGLGKPTGFEEYYADGPMTPAEHEESRQLYDPYVILPPFVVLESIDFLLLGPTHLNSKYSQDLNHTCRPGMLINSSSRRIQEALTQYQWKRRMENDRRAIFFKYLQYGGVDASQNHATGISPKELKQISNDEARQAHSQTMIQRDRQGLEVNFEKVARGFLYVQESSLTMDLANDTTEALFMPITSTRKVRRVSRLQPGRFETSSHIFSIMTCVPNTRTTFTRRGGSAILLQWSFGGMSS